jgi:DnaJ-domain-containing protein 1
MARRSLNELQDRVVEFEERGGIDGFIDRLTEDIRQQQNLLLEGNHPLNPDYQRKVRQWYDRLELEYGANEEEVRAAYRRLMREYHPDRFANSERGERLATQVSQELTVAYTGLINYLDGS